MFITNGIALDNISGLRTIKFLANKSSNISRVYLTKARYVSADHMHLRLGPHVLFSLPVWVRMTSVGQRAEPGVESHGKGMSESGNTSY